MWGRIVGLLWGVGHYPGTAAPDRYTIHLKVRDPIPDPITPAGLDPP